MFNQGDYSRSVRLGMVCKNKAACSFHIANVEKMGSSVLLHLTCLPVAKNQNEVTAFFAALLYSAGLGISVLTGARSVYSDASSLI